MAQNLPSINTKQDESGQKTIKNGSVQGSSKSTSSKYMQRPWGFTVSNKKKDELQRLRKHEIERQDKALNSRMVAINQRSRKRIHSDIEAIYLKSSLHQGARRQFNKIINQENFHNRKRLESLKPTINVKKLEKDWQKKQSIKKHLQKYYSKESKYHSMSFQLNKNHSIQANEQKIVKFYKERMIGESKVLIKVEQYHHVILISGYLRQKDVFVYLIVQKEKLSHVLDEKSKAKTELLGNKLRFDSQTNSLYLVPQNSGQSQKKEYFISSKIDQFDFKQLKNHIKKEHLQLQRQLQMQKKQAKLQEKKKSQISNSHEKPQQTVQEKH